ncbi:Rpp20 subunit of nuclear RNase MRP and P-domain-containing protein [Lasiosphaeria ovina]|uniref:Rpp20 subunit of nuclear RNase MRP and P-domain-containing protein n=1 Tax=Lasiosphaeria ovina TaxID=92902 RepID=A0AAE0K0W6_9PEZI|nr:Rpp20 subunit of nuclear RNase MRP and P-domain-containing protein [Lasiosphaeria ovina]
MDLGEQKTLSNRRNTKLPPIPKGFRIQKRPLPRQSLSHLSRDGVPDADGYMPGPRASHTVVINVTAKTPFMSLVKRVRKALENGPEKTKGLSLATRMAALQTVQRNDSNNARADGGSASSAGFLSDSLDDVVMVATGRAIQKAVEIGAFFTREKELLVVPRTRSLAVIDDIVLDDDTLSGGEADGEDQVRVRNISALEIGIRWRSS